MLKKNRTKLKLTKTEQKMKMPYKIYSLVINKGYALMFLIMLSPFFLISQQQNIDREHNEQVTIVGTYDPTINQAFKINMKPDNKGIYFQKPVFTFQSLDVKQPTTIKASEIKPAKLRADKRATVYNNYLKAGFGSLLSPYINYWHSSGKRNDNRLNINVYHLSSFSDIPDYSPSPFSNTLAQLSYDKYLGSAILNVGFGYGLDTYRYYGFDPTAYADSLQNEADLKQSFNLIKANIGIRSNNKKENDFEYFANLGTYYYFDKWKSTGFQLDLDFDLAKPFDAPKSKDMQKAGIEGTIDFGLNSDSVNNSNDLILTGIPYYKAKFGMLNFKVGLNFSYLMADSSSFHFYPVVDVSVNVVEDMLTIYAGVNGGMVKNSYYDLTQINPWSTTTIPITWQNNKINIYAGLRGNISHQFGFNLGVNWLSFENMPFFYNVTDSPLIWGGVSGPLNKFDIALDNGSLITISGELNYTLGNALKLWLSGAYNVYSLDSLPQPYHKPISKLTLGGSYLIKKKVNVWLELFSGGKSYAVDIYTPTPTEIEIDGYFDINLGVDYNITEKFSVFLKGTNLLNNNYQQFYNYPVQGLQVMAGVGFRF